jgi:hypothetical protein
MVAEPSTRYIAERITTLLIDPARKGRFWCELADILEDGPQRFYEGERLGNIAIDIHAVSNLYRKVGVDDPRGLSVEDDSLFGWLPDRDRQLARGASGNGCLIVSAADFLARLGGTAPLKELLPDIRVSPEGMSLRRAVEIPATLARIIDLMMAVRDSCDHRVVEDKVLDPTVGESLEDLQEGLVAEKAGDSIRQLPSGYAAFSGSPGFRMWFAGSKVVFEEGEADYFQNPEGTSGVPRLVYYGTNGDMDFDIFRPDKRGTIWFRSNQTTAERMAGRQSAVVPAYLKIENPLELFASDCITMGSAMETAKARGNDGVILGSGGGEYLYAVFSADQVRSPLTGDALDGGEPRCARADKTGQAAIEHPRRQGGSETKGCHCLAVEAADATIGKQFRDIESKPVQIIGVRVKNYTDLAVLAQGWRNPNYEEFRYVFVRRGIIVDHERGSCMHPGYSRAYLGDDFGAYMTHLKERIQALDATAVYMVHNHPNGNPQPSDADIWASAAVAMSIPQFRGHIIINSGKYGYIDSTASEPVVKPLPKLPKDWEDPILHPSVPHELLGREADTMESVATWAKSLSLDREAPVLLYIDSDGKVRGLQEIHPRNFTNIPLIRKRMVQKLIDFGSVCATAVLPQSASEIMLDAVRYYVRAHVLRNAIGFCGSSPYYFGEVESDVEYFGGDLRASMAARPVQ